MPDGTAKLVKGQVMHMKSTTTGQSSTIPTAFDKVVPIAQGPQNFA